MNLLVTFDDRSITMKELNSLDQKGAQIASATKLADEGDGLGKAVIYGPVPVAIVPLGDLVDLSKLKIKVGDLGNGRALLIPRANNVSKLCRRARRAPWTLQYSRTRNYLGPRLGY
jgi:hypothetical protein